MTSDSSSSCAAVLLHIEHEFSWWFDGSEGACGGATIRRADYTAYWGEECVVCGKHPTTDPVIEIKYWDTLNSRPITFMCHEPCAESLIR